MTNTPLANADLSPLQQKFDVTISVVENALSSSDFYMELLCVGLSLAVSWLLAILIRKRVNEYVTRRPFDSVDAAMITKPLHLLAPILAILLLALMMPLAIQFSEGNLVDAAMKLTVAYLAARGVLLVVQSRPVAWFIAGVIMLLGVLRASGFLHDTILYLRSVQFDLGKVQLNMLNILHGVVSLVVVFWVAGALSRTLEGYLRRSSSLNYNTRELIVKFFKIFVYFTALLITLSAMGVDLTAFAVFGGALGVGIGLGLQKITANFVSGITLLVERSIQIGDLVEVGGQTGWVRQLNIRYMLMETPDGREILIPNDELISTRVTNWTHTNAQASIEVKVVIDYGSDAERAKELMIEAARNNKFCLKEPAPNCWLREFTDKGIMLVLIFWIPDVKEGRNRPQSDVMFDILDKFRKAKITFATTQ